MWLFQEQPSRQASALLVRVFSFLGLVNLSTDKSTGWIYLTCRTRHTCQTRLNKEMLMVELAQFRPGAVARNPSTFHFERTSVQLLASYQRRPAALAQLPLQSERRDPVVYQRGQA